MMASVVYWRGWKATSLVLLAGVVLYFVYFAITRPAWDWDMVPYTLAALSGGASDVAAVNAKTWAIVKAHLSDAEFAGLTTADAYRRALFGDAAALASQLPLYESKLGYILLLKGLSVFTDPIKAMMGVTLVSTLGALALLARQSWRIAGIATLGWLLLIKLFGLNASMTNPDMFITFIYMAGFAAFLDRRFGLAAGIFILAAIVRQDGVVLNLALAATMVVLSSTRAGVVLAVGSLAAYLLDTSIGHHIGWWPNYYFAFVEVQPNLTNFNPPFSVELYFSVLGTRLVMLLHLYWSYAALAVTMLSAILLARRSDSIAGLLLLAILAAAVLRFLAYPSTEIRLYWPIVFGLSMILLHVAAPASQAGALPERAVRAG
jgi:hypothetical protein